MAWWWDDNHDVHHWIEKSSTYKELGAVTSVSRGTEHLALQKTLEVVDLAVYSQQEFSWANGPVLTWAKYGNESEGYWAWTSTLTVPLPQQLCRIGDSFDLSLTVAILTDAKQPYGNYSKPKGVEVALNGFGSVYKTDIKAPVPVGGNFLTEVFLAAKAVVDETWPVPHIIITFNTENVGGVQGSVKIDYDTVVQLALAVVGAKLTLRAIR